MGKTTYLTNDPELSSIFLSESKFFTKAINADHPLYGIKDNRAGLFIADTDAPEWSMAHKFLAPAFTPKALRHYVPIFNETIKEIFPVFDAYDEKGEGVNVYPYMLKLGSQAIGKFVLQENLHHFDSPDAPLHPLVTTIAHSLELNKKVTSKGAWYGHLPFGDPKQLRDTQAKVASMIRSAMEKVPAGGDGDLPLSDAAQQATCIVDYVNRAVDSQGKKISGENLIPVLLVVMGAAS